MKKPYKLLGMVLLSLFAGLSGCQMGSNTKASNVKHIEDATIDATHPRAELIIGSEKLLGNIVLTNVRFGNVGNFQRAAVGIQNRKEARFSLEYKIEWQDDQGFELNTATAWHRVTLGPKQIKNIQSVGKDPDAYQILVTVRFPDDHFLESHKREQEDRK